MLDAEWNLTEVAEVALVEVSVHNPTAVDRRVRVENRLDGPTLPPRGDGVPERGWDADGYGGVVPAGETVRLGFASPAPPAEPPVAVEDEGRVDDAAGDGSGSERPADADAEAAVRLLDDAAPPADALPVPESPGEATDGRERDPAASTGTDATDAEVAASAASAGDEAAADDRRRTPGANGATGGGQRAAVVGDGGERDEVDRERGTDGGDCADGGVTAAAERRARERECGEDGPGARADGDAEAGEVPPPVEAWLADVERRVEHGERLTGASVVEAAAVLDDRGGFGAVEALPDRLAADEAALRALAERATALAERASGTDVPLAALRRLA